MTEKDPGTPQAPPAPKPAWEEKPVPPEAHEAGGHPLVQALGAAAEGAVQEATELAGQVTVVVPVDRLLEVCRACKDTLQFSFLVDLTAVDWQERAEGRFDVVYWMHRFTDSARLRVKVRADDAAAVPSVTGIWKVANWMEREVFDMFGIYFDGHPNLERILTWEGFNGHPLRKDFPIEGIDTGAVVYPDIYPPGGGPSSEAEEGS